MRLSSSSLQWRGGNVPARTGERGRVVGGGAHPSMEGRERSRPDRNPPTDLDDDEKPSMEGRERSRPDRSPCWSCSWLLHAFNGGAGTFPPGLAYRNRLAWWH